MSPRHLTTVPGAPANSANDALFGREDTLSALRALVRAGARQITLIGPPGVGKTTLARAALDLMPAPAIFVRLADVSDAAQLTEHLWDALHAGAAPGTEARTIERVSAEINRAALGTLALDNLEQLLPDASHLLSALLDACPALTLLVTSRERVGTWAEHLIELEPLDTCAPDERDDHKIADSPAASLFAARAQAIAPTLKLDAAAWRHIAAICHALDGLPLAIELVAARLRIMSLEQLSHRLLAQPIASSLASLDRSLAASWELLDTTRQDALALLSSCVGGFEVNTAEALLEPLMPGQGLELLQDLRDRSLISRAPDRLTIYRYIKDFALARLPAARLHALRRAHALHFAQAAEAVTIRFEHNGDLEPLRWVSAERENLSAALDHLLTALDEPDEPRCWWLASALTIELVRQGSPAQRAELTRRIARLIGDDARLARAPIGALVQIASAQQDAREIEQATRITAIAAARAPDDPRVAWIEGLLMMGRRELAPARARGEAALPRAREADMMLWVARLHIMLGSIAYWGSDLEQARAQYERGCEIMGQLGAASFEAVALSNLCFIASILGERSRATRFGERALALFESQGDLRGVGTTHGYLAMSCMNWEMLDEALAHLNRAATIQEQTGQHLLACFSHLNRAQVLLLQGHIDQVEPILQDSERRLDGAHHTMVCAHNAGMRSDLCEATSDWTGALDVLRRCLAEHGVAGGHDYAAHYNARCAALCVKLGRVDEARAHMRAAWELAEHVQHPHYTRAFELFDTLLVPADDDWDPSAKLLARTMAVPLAGQPPFESAEPLYHNSILVRGTARTIWAVLTPEQREQVTANARDPGAQQLVVSASGERFRPPGDTWRSIGHRPALVRLFGLLREARARDAALTEEAIMEGMWPGERIMPDAATNRIHNAIALLRRAGLNKLIVRSPEGYTIDPQVPVVAL